MNQRNHSGDAQSSTTRPSSRSASDRGSVLVLVLVMVVIGALIVIPVMTYGVTVMKANTVLSAKTQRFEAVKAGMRTALYDPLELYRQCDEEVTPKPISSIEIGGSQVDTTCQLVGFANTVLDDHLRFGLAATELGQTIPPALKGKKFVSTGAPGDWVGLTTSSFENPGDPDAWDKIWLPDLPTHPRTIRTRVDGHNMPAGFGGCTVYFPGKYVDDLVLDGETFFTSGIYYFEGEVRVLGGADVVVGDGRTQGCASSQEAVFFADPPLPPGQPHNITGFGATWLFGGEGRLVVSNANAQPLRFEFNRRYVDDPNSDPSLFVSIASVNGELLADGMTYQDVSSPTLSVPMSRVMVGKDTYETPIAHEMVPSLLTPTPRPPATPVAVSVVGFRKTTAPTTNGAYITWTASAPADQGGAAIERYEVFRNGTTTPLCTVPVATGERLDCLITGLAGSSSGVTHDFDVVAVNAKGPSAAAPVSVTIRSSGSPTTPTYAAPTVAVPATPPTEARFLGAFRVSIPTVTPGTLPVTRYTITALRQSGASWVPTGTPCSIDPGLPGAPTSCIVRGLTLSTNHRFRVTAENELASVSRNSSTNLSTAIGLPAAPADPVLPAPPGLPVVPPYVTPPIVELDLAANSTTSVRIPGYIAVPQSPIAINNPLGHPVQVIGGVLAGRMNVVDGRNATGACAAPVPPAIPGVNCVDLGFQAESVQKRLRIVSSTPGGVEQSVAVIQVNENGAYAVNSWEVQ